MSTTTTDASDLLTRARAAVPDLRTLLDAAERARVARAALRDAPNRAEPALVAELADRLAAGEDVPADLPDRAHDARSGASARRDDALRVLAATERGLRDRADNALAAGAGDALDVLRADLDDLVARARPALAELGEVRTADEAIHAGLAEHWRTLRESATEYVELRRVHARIVSDIAMGLTPDRSAVAPRWGRRGLRPADAVLVFGHLADAADAVELPADPGDALRAVLATGVPLGVPGPGEIRDRAEAESTDAQTVATRTAAIPVNRPMEPYAMRPGVVVTDPELGA